ncbi:NAD(P)/FAD-dependent oxidoreductase [Listeria booriae]|uniref:FAD-binding oxidoreductase n=1 Tax=Listeria booriae TaxID=1552123 RepID=A0A7X0WDA3_9LIST|nr:FAD-binding oxidoreductase [Listeria booriae]MBC1330853.1 FAD-binding oxidoreductase [Listeria booriae]MBC2386163.1 FAD-binding oxidoreductase [Listeria booriae]
MEKIVIIGGGIVGMTAAYLLSKQQKEVLVIDKQERGQATYAAAGIVCPWLSKRRNKVWYELAKDSARYYPALIEQLAQDTTKNTGYKMVGALCLRDTEEKLIELEQIARSRKEEAPEIGDIKRLTPSETQDMFPIVDPGFGSVYVSGGARVDGASLVAALQDAAMKQGATVIHGKARLEKRGETVQVVAGEQHWTADKIILAAGAWLPELIQPLGLQAAIHPQKGQLLHLEWDEQVTNDWPVVLPPSAKSIVPFDDGRMIIGATHENEAGFDLEPTEAAKVEILDEIARFAPEVTQTKIAEIRVGTRPFTPDFTPIIGALPTAKSIFVANGLGSSGLTTGPYVAKLLVDLIAGKTLQTDITGFDPSNAITS